MTSLYSQGLSYGDLTMVRVGVYKRRAAKILPHAAQGRRTRTIRVQFLDDDQTRWVRPDQLEPHPQAEEAA